MALKQLDEYRWQVPVGTVPGMRVPGLVFADAALMDSIRSDRSLEQVANVATLPGILGSSIAMPDIHWGYGFPVGGVAATDGQDGVVSPGGIGFDINCGVRLLSTPLVEGDLRGMAPDLADALYRDIPAGVGRGGRIKLRHSELSEVMEQGAGWAVEAGYGHPDDLRRLESGGLLSGADPGQVSSRARERGSRQLGTLGSGNHFLEVQKVDEIYDQDAAERLGIGEVGQITILIHTGSRGFGHQVCQDYLKVMNAASTRYGINLPDRQLACAPIKSPEAQRYLAAMAAAANFAFANRQCLTQWVRDTFAGKFGKRIGEGIAVVYDVAHNIAKIETHQIDGVPREVCVHRKGATRAFPPGHPELPEEYKAIGQPVLVPGDMGRYSYVAVGSPGAMELSFGSSCHGAGRMMSRKAAKKLLGKVDLTKRLESENIYVRARARGLLAEEAPEAYKDVAQVMRVVDGAGLCRNVVRLRPMVVIKG